MKIVIFGGRGYLGQYFAKQYPGAVCPSVDIADIRAVADVLEAEKPDVVINCAGKTGRPNVDWCEDHKAETVHSNVVGPLVLVEECEKRGMYLVHLGTGCVYSGDADHLFTEIDPPNFTGSFYSRTKGMIDQLLGDFPVLNIRLRMPFDGSSSERNLIAKLKKYEKLIDIPNSMTYIPEMLEAVDALIQKKAVGPYNVVNPGTISPYRIMELYSDIVDPSHSFAKFSEEEMLEITKAGRSNCALSTEKLQGEGIVMSPIEVAVKKALETLKSSQST